MLYGLKYEKFRNFTTKLKFQIWKIILWKKKNGRIDLFKSYIIYIYNYTINGVFRCDKICTELTMKNVPRI